MQWILWQTDRICDTLILFLINNSARKDEGVL